MPENGKSGQKMAKIAKKCRWGQRLEDVVIHNFLQPSISTKHRGMKWLQNVDQALNHNPQQSGSTVF